MTIARLSLSLLFALSVLGCGEEGGVISPALDVHLSALQGDEILQFVVMADRDRSGADLTCAEVTPSCVADQPRLRIRALDTPGGSACAYRAALDPVASRTTDGQPISVPGIPPGTGYLLVVEVIRPVGRGEERIGSGCLPIERVVKGTNPPPSGTLDVRAAGACMPALTEC